MNGRPTCSVVIVTFNSADIIVDCLGSIPGATSFATEVIVVDNASTDGTVDLIARRFPYVKLIRNESNCFYAAASNQGIRAATGEFILLLNPDVQLARTEAQPSQNAPLNALIEILRSNPVVAATAPMLILPSGTRQSSLRELPGLDTLWYDLLGLSFLFPKSKTFGRWRMGYFDGLTGRMVEQPMASCLLVPRGVFERIGLFDESYPMFFNDVDWCRRVKNAGLTIWYTPDVRVRHIGGATVKKYRRRMIWMSHAAYYRYLRQLHFHDPIKSALVVLSWIPLMGAACVRSLIR